MALAGCADQIGLIRGDGPPVSSIRGNLKRHPRPGKYQIRAGQVASRSLMVEILSNGDGTDRDGIPDDKDEDDSGLAAHVGDDAVGRPRDAGRASGVEVEDAVADADDGHDDRRRCRLARGVALNRLRAIRPSDA